jgi:MFS family permease
MGAAAAACGPTLGALLTQYASWRWFFLVNVPICAAVIVFGVRILCESRDPHAGGSLIRWPWCWWPRFPLL